MATAQALRELRCDDRTSLGRHRRLLPPREQSLPRLRRRSQQQNPRPSTPCLWSARSGIPAPQGPDLHAPGALKNPKIHPHDFKKTQRSKGDQHLIAASYSATSLKRSIIRKIDPVVAPILWWWKWYLNGLGLAACANVPVDTLKNRRKLPCDALIRCAAHDRRR